MRFLADESTPIRIGAASVFRSGTAFVLAQAFAQEPGLAAGFGSGQRSDDLVVIVGHDKLLVLAAVRALPTMPDNHELCGVLFVRVETLLENVAAVCIVGPVLPYTTPQLPHQDFVAACHRVRETFAQSTVPWFLDERGAAEWSKHVRRQKTQFAEEALGAMPPPRGMVN